MAMFGWCLTARCVTTCSAITLRALPLPTQGMAEPLGIITRQEALSSPEQQRLIAALRQRVLDVPV